MQNNLLSSKKALIPFFLFLIILDQTAKFLIAKFQLNIFKNYGAVFGLGKNYGDFLIFFIALFVILFFFKKNKFAQNQKNLIGFLLLFAGGISNLIDRIFRGYVFDYIFIKTAVFNLADLFILLGGIILLTQIITESTFFKKHK